LILAPALIFSAPGLLQIFHGKRMMRGTSVSLLKPVEMLAAIVNAIAIFSYIARRLDDKVLQSAVKHEPRITQYRFQRKTRKLSSIYQQE